MIKKFFAFAMLIVMLNFTTALAAQSIADYSDNIESSFADNINGKKNSASVVDTQNLLTADEINRLTQKIQQVEQKHQVKIGIEFLKNTHGQSLDNAANSLLDKNFSGAQNGGILLLVVMDTRKWKISTDSTMRQRIPDAQTAAIANNFVSYLSDGYYYDACNRYIDDVDKYLTYYETNGTPYDPSSEFDPLALMIAIFLAIIGAVMFRSMLIGSMSNVHTALSAMDYLKRETVKLTEKKDTYLFTNVTRRRKSRSSSSSGGGGGGSHGGSSGSF